MSFSNVQQFLQSDPLSAMGSLPLLGETQIASVLGLPNLGSFLVPDSSQPGKDPNFQVRALFGTDKLELQTLDPETRHVMKDLLKSPVYSGDWVTFKPLWDLYRGFWCKRMAPDLRAHVFCSCFTYMPAWLEMPAGRTRRYTTWPLL